MRLQRLSVVQWVGALVAPLVWATQHVLGYGIGTARCSDAGVTTRPWVSNTVWELVLLGVAVLLVLGSEAAAVLAFRATRGEDAETSRLHFFAVAAMVANVLFLAIMLMDGLASALESGCVGS